MNSIAACLLAFDRPHYLRDTVERLEKLESKDDTDWYLFQDGQYNPHGQRVVAEERDLEICNNILEKADLPNKKIIRSEENRGIALQYSKALELLEEDYRSIITFEDDILVSKYTLELTRRLMFLHPFDVPTVYSRPDRNKVENIQDNLNTLVKCKTAAFHTTGISARIYEGIRDRYKEYIEMVSEVDYRDRDHEKIKEEFGSRLSSHDSVVNKILADNGYGRIRPLITRAIYIGQDGVHYSPESFSKRHRYNSANIDYEIDRVMNSYNTIQAEDDLF